MIVFDFVCVCGLVFEGWFQDTKDLSVQIERNVLSCPDCGSFKVRKILSPVKTSSCKDLDASSGSSLSDQSSIQSAQKILKNVQDFVVSNFEDVGARMAEESLKIHYGVAEPRNIRGVVSDEEEKTLNKEGIELLRITLPANGTETN